MAGLDLRLRIGSAGLIGLPWLVPLADWDPDEVPLRDLPIGPHRHLVRFVEVDGLWALKELPLRIAQREYDVLRVMEQRGLPAVRPAGVVVQPQAETAILVTRYLERSWQYRRLFTRLPNIAAKHRERLLDAMVGLLVDLHRAGIYWGDCSLANTLFVRDGQALQAWMVDAETSEIHPSLSEGQRLLDLEILVENVAGGLLDVAARVDAAEDQVDQVLNEVDGLRDRYHELWTLLHEEPTVRLGDRHEIEARIRRLHERGFEVEEVRLVGAEPGADQARLQFVVAERGYHAEQLRARTGVEAGEGQAIILLDDLLAYEARWQASGRTGSAAQAWRAEVFEPGVAKAFAAVGGVGDPIQAFCDLLEVRWLLSEEAGHDVGDEPALEALRLRSLPSASAAEMAIADVATMELPVIRPGVPIDDTSTRSSG